MSRGQLHGIMIIRIPAPVRAEKPVQGSPSKVATLAI